MRTATILTLLAMAVPAVPAWADEVRLVGGASFRDVSVVTANAGDVVFDAPGRRLRKPVGEVTFIRLDDRADYTDAESRMRYGLHGEAAGMFDALAGEATDPRVEALARWRAVRAWELAGRIDRSLAGWLALVDAGDTAAIPARPRQLPPAGSEANRLALELLEARLADPPPLLRPELERARAELRTHEGLMPSAPVARAPVAVEEPSVAEPVFEPTPPAEAVDGAVDLPASPLAGVGAPGRQGGAAAVADVPPAAAVRLARLYLAQRQDPARAMAVLTTNLSRLGESELPEALWLLARARLVLADGPGARREWARAGVDLMRVYAYWPESPFAPQALHLAAQVCEQLGDPQAAGRVRQRLAEQYPQAP